MRIAIFCGALCALALGAHPTFALDKAQPDSISGHGQARDQWLVKGTETRANCGGPVSSQRNPATGAITNVCRVDGRVVEVERAKPKGSGN